MALSEFGRLIRKARVDAGVNLSDMASALQVSAAFLSSLETGKKNISNEWVSKIQAFFLQKGISIIGLQDAANISNQSVPLEGLSLQHQMLVSGFARITDQDDLEKFRRLLMEIDSGNKK